MGVGQRVPPGRSATGRPQPNQALELTAKTPAFWPQLTAGVRLLTLT